MKFGYTVITASTGEEALEIYSAKQNYIDLVLMDLGMPGMGGHKCLQELLQIDSSVKVIITSGYSINGHVKKSMEAGAIEYVGKPYKLAELLNTVREILDVPSWVAFLRLNLAFAFLLFPCSGGRYIALVIWLPQH